MSMYNSCCVCVYVHVCTGGVGGGSCAANNEPIQWGNQQSFVSDNVHIYATTKKK